ELVDPPVPPVPPAPPPPALAEELVVEPADPPVPEEVVSLVDWNASPHAASERITPPRSEINDAACDARIRPPIQARGSSDYRLVSRPRARSITACPIRLRSEAMRSLFAWIVALAVALVTFACAAPGAPPPDPSKPWPDAPAKVEPLKQSGVRWTNAEI